MGFSLEFGRYGAEGLSKLVSEKAPKHISRELGAKLSSQAKKIEDLVSSDTFTHVDKFGRKITTNKSGFKEILDKEGNLIYSRRPHTKSFEGFRSCSNEGYPTLNYLIYRPNSQNDRTTMVVKLTENGFSGDNIATFGEKGTKFYKRKNNI